MLSQSHESYRTCDRSPDKCPRNRKDALEIADGMEIDKGDSDLHRRCTMWFKRPVGMALVHRNPRRDGPYAPCGPQDCRLKPGKTQTLTTPSLKFFIMAGIS